MPLLFLFVSGLSIGSFLNVLIDRMPRGEDIVVKPSHCDYCKKRLRWFELIPLLSYLLQLGKCRRCHHRLSLQYPSIELLTALGFCAVYLVGFTTVLDLIGRCVVVACAIVILMIDMKHQIIPDSMLIGMVGAALILGIPYSREQWMSHLISMVACGGFFLLLYLGTRGRGIGFGDVKLAAVLGLLLGFPGSLIACYVAFLTGAFYGVILMIIHKAKLKTRIAFGPFLLLGIGIASVFGSTIWAWWKTLV